MTTCGRSSSRHELYTGAAAAFTPARLRWGTPFLENAMLLGILGWIVVGLIVGFVASKAVNLRGDDPKLGMGAAAGGAILGGLLFSVISVTSGWNPWGLLWAAGGALLSVIVWHAVRSRSISHAHQTQRSSY
jgi:uncharacterized membrane protein YeaQ/YmgE (transglycosylase-associated protein family)